MVIGGIRCNLLVSYPLDPMGLRMSHPENDDSSELNNVSFLFLDFSVN